jgi:hypothetical protein
MIRFNSTLVGRAIIPAALALLLGVPSAGAQTSYPRVVSDGANFDIDYGPLGNQSAPLGGGRVVVTGTGEDAQFRHLDPEYVQRGRDGLKPVTVGSGESATTVWVPNSLGARELALLGSDGSLPAQSGNRALAWARIGSVQ